MTRVRGVRGLVAAVVVMVVVVLVVRGCTEAPKADPLAELLADSLRVALARADSLYALARARDAERTRDSLELAEMRGRLRFVPAPETTPADDPVTTYELPAPVYRYVVKLEASNAKLRADLAAEQLATIAARNATAIAVQAREHAERRLAEMEERRLKERAGDVVKGAVGGVVVTIVAVAALFFAM